MRLVDTRPPAERIEAWFAKQGWSPHSFQRESWAAYLCGESGLLNVGTGQGKTLAAFLGPLTQLLEDPELEAKPGIKILYLSPLRAVTRDIERTAVKVSDALGLALRIEARTADTSASMRRKQQLQLPDLLLTTPESLALLLSRDNAAELFASLQAVIVDEWHELLSSKRGSLLELSLATLRQFAPDHRRWGMSATLANLDQAAALLVGVGQPYKIITGPQTPVPQIESILPESIDAFPYAGHLGLHLVEKVIERLNPNHSTLLFTNTRYQAERWYGAIRTLRPDWEAKMALHHSAVDRNHRETIEAGLRDGDLQLVVCTSSLDLGIDWSAVEEVVQVGSPKGLARLLQRAGRSQHQPGGQPRLIFVPTHALEILEILAIENALLKNSIEPRFPTKAPLDVLLQHLTTRAIGGGFTRESIKKEIRSATSFAEISDADLDWAIETLENKSLLKAYENFRKIEEVDGVFRIANKRLALLHRLNIGTITSDPQIEVRFQKGKRLGSVEETYISRLRTGDKFLFAGKVLEFRSFQDLVCWVRLGKGKATESPRWQGGKLPYSDALSQSLRDLFAQFEKQDAPLDIAHPRYIELDRLLPLTKRQSEVSSWPASAETLVEIVETREGRHLYLYPFEGRLVHEGLAALLAYRLSRDRKVSFSLASNDYGLEILGPKEFPFEDFLTRPEFFSSEGLTEEIEATLNLTELSRRQFREIARVAGYTFQHYPGTPKSLKQVQASSGLLFDVFKDYDPGHRLLAQSQREVLEKHFEVTRLAKTLDRIRGSELKIKTPKRLSPLAFPLWVERLQAQVSSETLIDRIERMRRDSVVKK